MRDHDLIRKRKASLSINRTLTLQAIKINKNTCVLRWSLFPLIFPSHCHIVVFSTPPLSHLDRVKSVLSVAVDTNHNDEKRNASNHVIAQDNETTCSAIIELHVAAALLCFPFSPKASRHSVFVEKPIHEQQALPRKKKYLATCFSASILFDKVLAVAFVAIANGPSTTRS